MVEDKVTFLKRNIKTYRKAYTSAAKLRDELVQRQAVSMKDPIQSAALQVDIDVTEKRLKEYGEKIQQFREQIQEASGNSQSNNTSRSNNMTVEQFYVDLVDLNYYNQTDVFRQNIENLQALAYLIHGKEKYGQYWLLHRLVKIASGNEQKTGSHGDCLRIFRFDFNSRIPERNINMLWWRLGLRLGVDGHPQDVDAAKDEIIEHLHKLLEKHSVALFFDNVMDLNKSYMEDYVNEFVQNFWLPLTKKLAPQSLNNYLFMFLVEHQGHGNDKKPLFTGQYDSALSPYIPIALKKLSKLNRNDLINWIQNHSNTLPIIFLQQDSDIVKNIMDESRGIPEVVMDHLCRFSKRDWEVKQKEWISRFLDIY